MARFQYQARNGRGQLDTGVIAAASLEEAGKLLRSDGRFVVKLNEMNGAEAADEHPVSLARAARRVRRSDVIYFANQISVMLETGVPISEALECLVDQVPNPNFRVILRDVVDQVQAGNEFSAALKRHPRVFPSVMTSLLRASELSGTMSRMLERISGYLSKEQKIVRQVRGALMYPAFMFTMTICVTVFLLTFVMPRFAAIFASRHAALPGPTRLLLAISGSMVHQWYFWIAGVVMLVLGLFLLLRSESGGRLVDTAKLRAPLFGHMFTCLYVTRSCRTLGTMFTAGVSMLDAVEIVRSITRNRPFQDMWDEVNQSLRQGMQLSDPLLQNKLFPRSLVQMIRSGEKSGRLGQVMERVAEFTENEFDAAVKVATQFIEPAMIILMGSIVGFVAISLLLPIFTVSKVIAGGH